MEIIDGRLIASRILEELKEEVHELKEELNVIPALAVIIVGNDPASKMYVNSKKKACKDIGINSEIIELPEDVSSVELIETIEELNQDSKISGILIQMPLPKHINESEILMAIKPKKDVDGFHPENAGRLLEGNPLFEPCTPSGIIYLLEQSNIEIESKKCVVIGSSNIVGKPAAIMMLNKNATVTICHSKTKEIEAVIKQADIVIIAIGKANYLKGYMLKQDAVVIDVGINRVNGSIFGDADFESVSKVARFVTPVPGGVGPMTIAMLMKNTIKAAKINNSPYMNTL